MSELVGRERVQSTQSETRINVSKRGGCRSGDQEKEDPKARFDGVEKK